MSSAPDADAGPKTAIKVADLSILDAALRGDDAALAAALKRLRPADVGRDLSRRTVDAGHRIVKAQSDRSAALALRSAHHSVGARIVAAMDPARAGKLLSLLPTEHRVGVMTALEPADLARLEAALSPEDRAFLERTRALDISAVGRIMTPSFWSCGSAATAGEALDALAAGEGRIEVAPNCYVIDPDGCLVGVVPLRLLATTARDKPVAELMTTDVVTVVETLDRASAAEIIQTYDFLSLPVVDAQKKMVGAVRVDDLLDAALDKVSADILNQGAVASKVVTAEPYFQTSIARVVRSRVTWLVLLFVAETATGTVLRYFEEELARVVALAFFIPLLIGTGGNAGSQTVSTIIRALALGEVRVSDALRVVAKEVTTGVILGVLLGIVAYFRAQMWGVDANLAACVAVTIVVVCTWANLVGAIIPLAAQKLKIDPTVVSGPMITTLVDATGLALYLTIAHMMIPALSAP